MSGFTLDTLRECLDTLAPVELLGMTLLRSSQQLFPTGLPRNTLREAVAELVAYTERCAKTVAQLMTLPPMALTAVSVVEYGL
ncbi:MAG: hypothetical protein HY862_02750 [Chloroflexi bacterium]|nr:hypothetical protein [Chloroflexota bacterium]